MGKIIKSISCENCDCVGKGIFCDVPAGVVEELGANKVINTYKKGQTLFLQGTPAFGVYCIRSGKIKISKIGGDGKEIILRIAGPSDVLGHQNLCTNDNYTATATVIEEATVCFIDKKYMLALIAKEPAIALNVIRKLSDEMAAFENRNAAMSYKNVRERLAELLLLLKNNYGVNEYGRFRLDIKLTREEMASMVGTANETIIRFISEFKEEGILEQEGKVIYIRDVEKLKLTANL
jgi:CRP-like cAMP-binding protein